MIKSKLTWNDKKTTDSYPYMGVNNLEIPFFFPAHLLTRNIS